MSETVAELIEAGRIASEQMLAKVVIEESNVPLKDLLTEQAGYDFGKCISFNGRFGHTVQPQPAHFDAEKHSFETFAFSREQLEELLNKVVEESKEHPGERIKFGGAK